MNQFYEITLHNYGKYMYYIIIKKYIEITYLKINTFIL